MADRLELRGLRVLGTHGLLPEEQERAQPFEIDLDIAADFSTAAGSDAVADTLDYGTVCEIAAAVVAGEHVDLLERLAGRIAAAVLDVSPPGASVTVTVRKLRPPVPFDLGSAAVTVTRSR